MWYRGDKPPLTPFSRERIMGSMRLRIGALAFVALVLAVVCGGSGCKLAGVSAVYMAIDSQGAQPRDLFFTDTASIYCVALYSGAKQDSTVDFTIKEINGLDGAPALHNVFSNGEQVPGPGTETPVSFQIPPNGVDIQISCLGYCFQNGVGCPNGYMDQGLDSCGVGATCCFNMEATSAEAPTVIPYPVGDFSCTVSIDGVAQGETLFTIDYPPMDGGALGCPVPPPVSGVICADWVAQNAVCPGFYSYQTCTCKGSSWQCEGTAP
jgi:hypothetical protein